MATTSDAIQLLLQKASELNGKTETTNNQSPEIDHLKILLYGKTDNLAYCADTVCGLVKEVDDELGTSALIPRSRSARSLWNLSIKDIRIPKPEVGSVVIYGMWDQHGHPEPFGHCGIVVELLPNGRMTTFEGNTKPDPKTAAEDRDGDGFYYRNRSQVANSGPMRILGFLRIWGTP